jgi:hypothetical protein
VSAMLFSERPAAPSIPIGAPVTGTASTEPPAPAPPPPGAWRPARVPASAVVMPGARPLPEPVARPQDAAAGGPPIHLPPRSVRPGAVGGPPQVPPNASPSGRALPPSEPPEEEAPAAGEESQDDAERALEAMADFRKADTALQRNDLAVAERLAKKAVEGDPDNTEYRALVSWLTALSGKKESVKEALHGLNDVLKDDALCERALLYRGKLLKRENRNSEALRDFMTVLDVNPKNNEAASEVRLLRMKKKK